MVRHWFAQSITQKGSLYEYSFGSAALRKGFARFLSLNFAPSRSLNHNHLVGGDGALSVLDQLIYCLFDARDTVALLVPCYPQHLNCLEFRNDVNVLKVHGYAELLSLLDSSGAAGIKGILFSNPSNPTGSVLSRTQLETLVEVATKKQIHLICDEIYAPTTFGAEFCSLLQCSLQESPYIHIVTGLAKIGFSGAKIGFLYTESPNLIAAMRALSRMAALATPGALAAERMLSSPDSTLQSLVLTARRQLCDQYNATVNALRLAFIPYVGDCKGGLTIVLDLREVCKNHGQGEGWAREEWLNETLIKEARVQLAPGRQFGFPEPGFFRMTIAEPLPSILSAISRIRTMLEALGALRSAALASVLQRMQRLWGRTDILFGFLKESAFLEKPIHLRHPYIFYVGHLPSFCWNQLRHFAPEIPHFDAELAILFERGIDPDVDDPSKVHSNSAGLARQEWPSLSAVLQFRDQVRQRMPALVAAVLAKDPNSHEELVAGRIFDLVYEHEAMHQETLLYMMHCMKLELFEPSRLPPTLTTTKQSPPLAAPTETNFVHIPGNNRVPLGSPDRAKGAWGWDNEFPQVHVAVEPFSIRKTPITNGEFLAFLVAGAYRNKALWDEQDWEWLQKERVEHPVHWVRRGDVWHIRTLFAVRLLAGAELNWPVQVSLAEAKAWCRWKGEGIRLPTEAEWVHAAYSESTEHGFRYRQFPSGSHVCTTGKSISHPPPPFFFFLDICLCPRCCCSISPMTLLPQTTETLDFPTLSPRP